MLCSTNTFACLQAKETQIYSSLFNQFYIPVTASFLNTSGTEICLSLEAFRSSVIHLHHNRTRVTWVPTATTTGGLSHCSRAICSQMSTEICPESCPGLVLSLTSALALEADTAGSSRHFRMMEFNEN